MSAAPAPHALRAYLGAQTGFLRRLDIAWGLARRELTGRYRGSMLGFLWSFAEPFLLICIFYFVFVFIFEQQHPNYLLYLVSGLLPFTLFNNALVKATGSIVANTALIRQIYCPRQVFVAVGILGELNHFAYSLVVLVPFYFLYRAVPGPELLAVVPITALLALFTFGLGLFLAAFNVFVRDTTFFVGLVLRLWFYLTPVFYTTERLDNAHHALVALYRLNPMAAFLDLYRWALIGAAFPDWPYVLLVAIETALALAIGSAYFHARENEMVKLL